jgi:hypothetical protein
MKNIILMYMREEKIPCAYVLLDIGSNMREVLIPRAYSKRLILLNS